MTNRQEWQYSEPDLRKGIFERVLNPRRSQHDRAGAMRASLATGCEVKDSRKFSQRLIQGTAIDRIPRAACGTLYPVRNDSPGRE